jgi:hypothetical protein
VGKTCPEFGQHHPIEWRPRWNEKVEGVFAAAVAHLHQTLDSSAFECELAPKALRPSVLDWSLHHWYHSFVLRLLASLDCAATISLALQSEPLWDYSASDHESQSNKSPLINKYVYSHSFIHSIGSVSLEKPE